MVEPAERVVPWSPDLPLHAHEALRTVASDDLTRGPLELDLELAKVSLRVGIVRVCEDRPMSLHHATELRPLDRQLPPTLNPRRLVVVRIGPTHRRRAPLCTLVWVGLLYKVPDLAGDFGDEVLLEGVSACRAAHVALGGEEEARLAEDVAALGGHGLVEEIEADCTLERRRDLARFSQKKE